MVQQLCLLPVGAGVSAFATFGYADLKVKDLKALTVTNASGTATGASAKNQDAWTIVTGLTLSF